MTAPLPTSFDYATLQKTYGNGIPCPPDFSFPHSVIDSWATKQPAAPAILWVSHDFKHERTVTYRQLSEESHKAAKVFQEHGIKKGDRCGASAPGGGGPSHLDRQLIAPESCARAGSCCNFRASSSGGSRRLGSCASVRSRARAPPSSSRKVRLRSLLPSRSLR